MDQAPQGEMGSSSIGADARRTTADRFDARSSRCALVTCASRTQQGESDEDSRDETCSGVGVT